VAIKKNVQKIYYIWLCYRLNSNEIDIASIIHAPQHELHQGSFQLENVSKEITE